NADGSSQMRLTNNVARDEFPAWSADGAKIVFQRIPQGETTPQLHVMNTDGSNVVNITPGVHGSYPDWSPDGKKVVFGSNIAGYADIFSANADGSNVAKITTDSETDYDPAWSADGKKIVFTSFRNEGIREIYSMNVDGSNQIRLTSNVDYDDHAV